MSASRGMWRVLAPALLLVAIISTVWTLSGAHSSTQVGDNELIVYHGTTACGVERREVKVRRVLTLYDCLSEARSSRGG